MAFLYFRLLKRLTFVFWRSSPIWASMASLLLSIWPLAPLFSLSIFAGFFLWCHISLSSFQQLSDHLVLVDSLSLFRCTEQPSWAEQTPSWKQLPLPQPILKVWDHTKFGLIDLSLVFFVHCNMVVSLWHSYAVYTYFMGFLRQFRP